MKTCTSHTLLCALGLALLAGGGCRERAFNTEVQQGGPPQPILSRQAPLRFLDLKESGIVEDIPVERVATARVILADYPVIRQDFPFLAQHGDRDIDAWLISQVAVTAKTQLELGRAKAGDYSNTEIRILPNQGFHALRPDAYGRALVFSAEAGGNHPRGPLLIEAKGTGTKKPSRGDHSNGLAFVHEAIYEYNMQKLVEVIKEKERKPWELIPCYAVIDLGFDAYMAQGIKVPAGMLVRRSHLRGGATGNAGGFPRYEENPNLMVPLGMDVELTLRKYGITSAIQRKTRWSPTGRREAANLQFTTTGALVDFGTLVVEREFNEPLVFSTRSHQWERDAQGNKVQPERLQDPQSVPLQIMPTDPRFVRAPLPALALDQRIWGRIPMFKVRHAHLSNVSLFAALLAFRQRMGMAPIDAFQQQHCKFLMPVVGHLGLSSQLFTSLEKCKSDAVASGTQDLERSIPELEKGLENAEIPSSPTEVGSETL